MSHCQVCGDALPEHEQDLETCDWCEIRSHVAAAKREHPFSRSLRDLEKLIDNIAGPAPAPKKLAGGSGR